MLQKLIRDTFQTPTSFVFLFVVIAGLFMGYARAVPPLSGSEKIITFILSFIYLVTGTSIFVMVLTSGSPLHKLLYLAFQIALGFIILVIERGNGWLIMIPLASHSVALFAPREAILPCIIITLGIAWNTSTAIPNWIPFLQSATVFGSAVFFAAVFTNISIRDSRRREEIERLANELEHANLELRIYATRVAELSTAQERNRLAREIHDGLGHYLTAMSVQIQLISTLLSQEPERARQSLSKLHVMVQEALADVRRSVAALRSDNIPGNSLPEALEGLINECREAGLVTELSFKGELRQLPAAIEFTIYRAAQEGLTNVRKHAHAHNVIVLIEYTPQHVRLGIRDDGTGSNLEMQDIDLLKSSFGLFGLRERVQILGGSMNVITSPNQGFYLEILLPEQHSS